jgi:outer membrane protein
MKNAIVVMIAGCLAAGTALGADLLGVYRDAVAYDAQFAAARAALEAGREKLPQGRSGLLPTVLLSGSSGGPATAWTESETRARATGISTKTQYNSNGWTISLSQPIFRWQNWIAYTQSQLLVGQAEAQFVLARQDLIVRAAQAYFDVLLAQDTLATAQAQKVAIAEQLESAKRNFEVGTATITDTHEAQARYDLTGAQEIAAENDLNVKRQVLRTVIGKEPDGLKNLRTGVQLGGPQPADIAKWVEMAETESALVLISQVQMEYATREVEKQRAGHYPTLDLVGSKNRSAVSNSATLPGGSDTNSTTIGLQLTIPIFGGGSGGFGYVMSKDREAVALKEKATADLDNARRTAALNARQAYLGVSSGLAQVKAYEAAITSSQSAVDSNKLGYEVGVRINIDVLNAQSQLFDTRQKLAKARLDTLAALLKLKAAAGSLGEEDVAAINALLQ